MKFYILAGINPTVSCNTSDSEFTSENLDEALEWFTSNKIDKKFRYAYFLVDFETQKTNLLKSSFKISPEESILPFLVLGEYNKNSINELILRKDNIILRSPGFEEEFSDNIAAVRKFIQLYENKTDCRMNIRYEYRDGNEMKINEPLIISSKHLYDNTKFYKKSKITVSPILWNPVPYIKERKFSKKQYQELINME